MYETVAVCLGHTRRMFIDRVEGVCEVTPFVGADSAGPTSNFGVGFRFASGGTKDWLWGLMFPRRLIQSWRAMKLLELIPPENLTPKSALEVSWYAAHESAYHGRYEYLDQFGEYFPSYEDSRVARADVLAMMPPDHELGLMLSIIERKGLYVEGAEVVEARKQKSSAEEVFARLCEFDEVRWENARRRADEYAQQEEQGRAKRRAQLAGSSTPRHRPLLRRLFG